MLKRQAGDLKGWVDRSLVPLSPDVLAGLRTLVVEDEANMRNWIRFVLQEQGATVRASASAAEALQQISATMPVPDMLISNIGLPEMDGYALMHAVQSHILHSRSGDAATISGVFLNFVSMMD